MTDHNTTRPRPLLLLSGIPATGKSSFGRWLEQEQGFVHLDYENGGLDRFGLTPAWRAICQIPPPDVTAFVSALTALQRPVAFDWGFPLPFLPLVEALHNAGIIAWWFDGDRAAARAAFVRRATVPVAALDIQMSAIGASQPLLADFYGSRVIQAISADGTFRKPQEILGELITPTLVQ